MVEFVLKLSATTNASLSHTEINHYRLIRIPRRAELNAQVLHRQDCNQVLILLHDPIISLEPGHRISLKTGSHPNHYDISDERLFHRLPVT